MRSLAGAGSWGLTLPLADDAPAERAGGGGAEDYAGWPAFDGPSSTRPPCLIEGSSCAGWPAFDGLAGPCARAARQWLASGSLLASAARNCSRDIDSSRDFFALALLLLRGTLAAPPARGRRRSPRGLPGLGSAAFSPVYCDQKPGRRERPALGDRLIYIGLYMTAAQL